MKCKGILKRPLHLTTHMHTKNVRQTPIHRAIINVFLHEALSLTQQTTIWQSHLIAIEVAFLITQQLWVKFSPLQTISHNPNPIQTLPQHHHRPINSPNFNHTLHNFRNHSPNLTLSLLFFLLVSWTRTQWVLNPRPHPPSHYYGGRKCQLSYNSLTQIQPHLLKQCEKVTMYPTLTTEQNITSHQWVLNPQLILPPLGGQLKLQYIKNIYHDDQKTFILIYIYIYKERERER